MTKPAAIAATTAAWAPAGSAPPSVAQHADASPAAPVAQWVTATGAYGSELRWTGSGGGGTPGLGRATPRGNALGLLLRREAAASIAFQRIDVRVQSDQGTKTLSYNPWATSYYQSSSYNIPLGGDAAEAGAGRWFLVALDLPADLALATRNASTGAHAALGRVESVSVVGAAVSVGGAWWWERMPERIATAGLGEWELARRQASEYDPALAATTDPFAKPHYEQRHWHLHRNGRFDVVGRSPLDPAPDGGAQAARVRQFSPYGRPIGEALVDPATGAAAPVGDALTPAEIDAHPANIFGRRRIWERGLTGKPWDPELGLYWFGYRWYSQTLRRWTQQEPLGLDGPNLYHFNFQQPITTIDPIGLSANDLADAACALAESCMSEEDADRWWFDPRYFSKALFVGTVNFVTSPLRVGYNSGLVAGNPDAYSRIEKFFMIGGDLVDLVGPLAGTIASFKAAGHVVDASKSGMDLVRSLPDRLPSHPTVRKGDVDGSLGVLYPDGSIFIDYRLHRIEGYVVRETLLHEYTHFFFLAKGGCSRVRNAVSMAAYKHIRVVRWTEEFIAEVRATEVFQGRGNTQLLM